MKGHEKCRKELGVSKQKDKVVCFSRLRLTLGRYNKQEVCAMGMAGWGEFRR